MTSVKKNFFFFLFIPIGLVVIEVFSIRGSFFPITYWFINPQWTNRRCIVDRSCFLQSFPPHANECVSSNWSFLEHPAADERSANSELVGEYWNAEKGEDVWCEKWRIRKEFKLSWCYESRGKGYRDRVVLSCLFAIEESVDVQQRNSTPQQRPLKTKSSLWSNRKVKTYDRARVLRRLRFKRLVRFFLHLALLKMFVSYRYLKMLMWKWWKWRRGVKIQSCENEGKFDDCNDSNAFNKHMMHCE